MREAMATLLVDAQTVHVLRAFAAAGVRSILLKGPALEAQLYADGTPRRHGDTDLLVPPGDIERAGRALSAIGLELILDQRRHSGVFEPHAQVWGPPGGPGTVDLHWRLAGTRADPALAWELLVQHTVPFAIGGEHTESLDRAGLAMLVALHPAQHGPAKEKPLADLERALMRFDRETWTAAAAMAESLGADEAFAAGLRLDPRGAGLAQELGLTRAMSPELELMLTSPPPGAQRLLELATSSGVKARLRHLRQALVPSPAFMRAAYATARRGHLGLALAYGLRLVKNARAAPGMAGAIRRSRGG